MKETAVNDLEHVNSLFAILKENKIKTLYCDLEMENILYELNKNGKLRDITKSLQLVNDRDIFHKNVPTFIY